MTTAAEEAAAVAASPEFQTDPEGIIQAYTSRSAQVFRRWDRSGWPEASRYTHIACLLVVAADNPMIVRGDVLKRLVGYFGEPL